MELSVEVWAVLISAAGIIATCIVESIWYKKQMQQQSEHLERQLQQQTDHLQEQLQFEVRASRQQRILQNQRDAINQVRKIAQGLAELDQGGSTMDPSLLLSLDFELFALAAMTDTLANDSEREHGENLKAQVVQLLDIIKALDEEAEDTPHGTPDAIDVSEANELLQQFSTAVLQQAPKSHEHVLQPSAA